MRGVSPQDEATAYLNLLKMQPLGDMVESHFGPRCAEYDPDCACCRAWRWLDTVYIFTGKPEPTNADREDGSHG